VADQHASGLVRIDPWRINPHWRTAVEPLELEGRDFGRLMASIQHLGGNVQPIKVRPMRRVVRNDATGEDDLRDEFEVVFGYARLHVCSHLGLPVLAIVEDLNDFEVVEQFVAEFRSHPVWGPWRLSRLIYETLIAGLFPSTRRAAEHLGMDLSELHVLKSLAELPEQVRLALRSVPFTLAQAKKLHLARNSHPFGFQRFRESDLPAKGRSFSMVLHKLTEDRS
jgi:ParB family chromosome partitioning protein